MKYKWPTGYISRMALVGFILGVHTGFAATPRTVAVQTAAEVDAVDARGASDADTIVLVLSATNTSVASLGSGTI